MNTRKLAKLDALMNQLIFAFMKRGMTYKQAKEDVFKMMKRNRILKSSLLIFMPSTVVSSIPLFFLPTPVS